MTHIERALSRAKHNIEYATILYQKMSTHDDRVIEIGCEVVFDDEPLEIQFCITYVSDTSASPTIVYIPLKHHDDETTILKMIEEQLHP